MDNFILYDEISKTKNTIIYKGRRKGSINFVSIHCIDKSLRAEITNLVRLTYEIVHKNIVKFYEWYETSNHLWLVVELCTGGTLDSIMKQDQCMPESSIRTFGADLCEGLHYLHETGLLFCDLNPKKIMVDGNGTLKLGDFGLSKLEGENLEEIFQEALENNKSDQQVTITSVNGKYGDPLFMAPEVHKGDDHSKSSDFWALGCLLYEMYTGQNPFYADTHEQIIEKILNKEFSYPKSNRSTSKPSSEFLSLLKGLLEKDPSKRFDWKQLSRHPFWEARLAHLVPSTSHSIMINDSILDRSILTDRPKTSHGQKPEVNVSFSMSSRLPVDVSQNVTLKAIDRQISEESNSSSTSQSISKFETKKNFFIASELNTSQIVDNPKIQKPSSFKFEPKCLPIANNGLFRAEKLLKLPRDEFNKQMELIKQNTNVPSDKTSVAIKNKLHLLNYIGFISMESSQIANELIDIELHKELIVIIKNGHNLEMKMKAARVIGVIFNRVTRIDPNKNLTEIATSLVSILQSNRNDVKFKQSLLPTLGELIFLIASQEVLYGKSIDTWSISSSAYTLIIRSFGDDLIVNHVLCKIIERLASVNSTHAQKLLSVQSDVVNSLWSCYNHSGNNESLRVTSLNALCLLTSHSTTIFQTLIDKVGIETCLECISSNNNRIQQSILTMFAIYIDEVNLKSIPEKKILSKITPVYDSTNVICRAKGYLLTNVILKSQPELIAQFSQTKLVNSIERDIRKTFSIKEEDDYIHKILNNSIVLMTNICLTQTDDLISILDSINGRKNPSTQQTKQLKKCIPYAGVLRAFMSSQTFRTKIFDDEIVQKFAQLIQLSRPFFNCDINLELICGTGTALECTSAILSMIEFLSQFKDILQKNSKQIIQSIVPILISNIDSSNSDFSIQSLRVLSDMCAFVYQKQEFTLNDELKKQFKTIIETQFLDLIEKLLAQQEPMPLCTITIIQLILSNDNGFFNQLKTKGILPLILKLLISNKTKIGNNLIKKLLNIISIWSVNGEATEMYENGIIECLKLLFIEIQRITKLDDKLILESLVEMLKILDTLLKFVSDFVKRALQAKKAAGSTDSLAQQAERLLHQNKSLVTICPFLLSLLLNDDNDIAEYACKNLWVIMQLFGGECKDLLNQENLNVLKVALTNSNSKRQKILLRIVKRIVTADKLNLDIFKTIAGDFINKLKAIKSNASAEANVNLSTMIDEILKLFSN